MFSSSSRIAPNLVVACVLKSGGRYSPHWVHRLKSMVARNLSLPHRFVVLSDIDVSGVETIPLRHCWPRWWSKIEVWGTAVAEADRILYLDLDVLITGSLDEIISYPAPIAFSPPHPVLVGDLSIKAPRGVIYKYQTSCMVWSPPAGKEIYEQFHAEIMHRLKGDQDWVAEVLPNEAVMPVEWFRKLRQCPDGPPNKGVKVVIGGKMKNDNTPFEWAKGLWRDGDLLGAQSGLAS